MKNFVPARFENVPVPGGQISCELQIAIIGVISERKMPVKQGPGDEGQEEHRDHPGKKHHEPRFPKRNAIQTRNNTGTAIQRARRFAVTRIFWFWRR